MPNPKIPIETLHLFPKLDGLLIDLLKSLTEEEWQSPTICKLWSVKDIASHLLDENLRTLSFSRDNYFGEKPPEINSYADLVAYLNQLNATWVNATKRLSTNVLIELLETTGKQFYEQLQSLKPFEKAIFSVAWAGQETSENWLHIAREYTEKLASKHFSLENYSTRLSILLCMVCHIPFAMRLQKMELWFL
jgi:Mycothiol maleylpyruvate isomerase N-terminal domain